MSLRRTPSIGPLVGLAVLFALAGSTAAAADAQARLAVQHPGLTVTPAADAIDGLNCNGPLIGNQCIAVRCVNCQATIPDDDELSQTVTVSAQDLAAFGLANCVINDLNVAVDLSHMHVGDLEIDFERPSPGPDATLYFPPASCTATEVHAIFDDESANPANACPLADPAFLRPDDSLDPFIGSFLHGQWTLEVDDLLPGDAGMMEGWGFAADVSCDVITDPCVPGPTTLCLQDDRFKVEVDWRTPLPSSGVGQAVELTPDTGYFWFFNQNNIEMVLKVLNGCPVNNHFWVFAGGLTNVEVEMKVTDTDTGQVRTYFNPISTPFQPVQDTAAFATCP